MARASLTAQAASVSGLTPALTAVTADGDVFDAGRVLLYVLNEGDDDLDVTIPTPFTAAGQAVADVEGTVVAGAFKLFGPFPRSAFGQAYGTTDAGRVYVDYSTTTDVARGLISV